MTTTNDAPAPAGEPNWQEMYAREAHKAMVLQEELSRLSAPAPAPSGAGARVLNDNGKRWRVESADGRWEIKPAGHIDAAEAKDLCERIAAILASPRGEAFQQRVQPWMLACFGEEISRDVIERNHRFLEEALELVQSTGCTASEAHQLVDYVFGREVGETRQEIGGVMVTLAALCLARGEDMHAAAETELARIWTKVEKIRAKQAAKPKHSPLPQHVPAHPAPAPAPAEVVERALAALVSAREQLEGYERDATGESYNDTQINAAIDELHALASPATRSEEG